MTAFSSADFIKELDSFFAKNDLDGAGGYLRSAERRLRDERNYPALLTVCNELVGYYRRTGEKDAALQSVSDAKALAHEMEIDARTRGTVLLNCATTLKAFGSASEAMHVYEQAERLLVSALSPSDPLLAGLYNNMALGFQDTGSADKAEEYFLKAIEITLTDDKNALETAVSYINLAHLRFERDMLDPTVNGLLDKAFAILSDEKYSGYDKYAFTCSKSAPSYGYFGRFADEKFLAGKAEEYYERARNK